MKYIETELKKRKGIVENEEQKVKLKNAEDSLYELPENIRVSSAKKTEEMLSNQMLSGIPEVDLGIEYVVHRSVVYGLNCQDEQPLIGRSVVWLDYTAPVCLLPWKQSACFCSSAFSLKNHTKYHSSAITIPKIQPLSTSKPTTLFK